MTIHDSTQMTLAKVRDWHRKAAKNAEQYVAGCHPGGSRFDMWNHQVITHYAMADAIDAHLAPRPVTEEDVERIVARVHREMNIAGMDGDSWDRILVRAALQSDRQRVAGLVGGVGVREDSCDDVDVILAKLGLTVEQARTEGGNLRVQRICNHIQETLDALAQAHAFGVEMSDKYALLTQSHVGVREGWVLVPVEPTDEMVSTYVGAVNAYLGTFSEKGWSAAKCDHHAALRNAARIGIKAMLAAVKDEGME